MSNKTDAAIEKEELEDALVFTNFRIMKNIVVLSFAFLLICTSVDGLQMLQSTLNRDKGIGVVSIAIQFAFGCITALFFMKFFILKFGTKMILTCCILAHIPSTVANFYPHWLTMIPSYAIVGIAATLLWGSNSAYLNNISNKCASNFKANNKSTKKESSYQVIDESNNEFVSSDTRDTKCLEIQRQISTFSKSSDINQSDKRKIIKNTPRCYKSINKPNNMLTVHELVNASIKSIGNIDKIDNVSSKVNYPDNVDNNLPSTSRLNKLDNASMNYTSKTISTTNTVGYVDNASSNINSSNKLSNALYSSYVMNQLDNITAISQASDLDNALSTSNKINEFDCVPHTNPTNKVDNAPVYKLENVLSTRNSIPIDNAQCALSHENKIYISSINTVSNLDIELSTSNHVDSSSPDINHVDNSSPFINHVDNSSPDINHMDKLNGATSCTANSISDLNDISLTINHKQADNVLSSTDPTIQEYSTSKTHRESLQDNLTSLLVEATTARFFGLHSMFYQSGHIWSNIVSFYVLQRGVENDTYIHDSSCMCGADFCNIESQCFESNLKEPSKEVKYLLISIFLALNILAVLLTAYFLDPLENKKPTVHYSLDFALATFNQLKRPLQLLVVPLSVYMGMSQGFFYADYPKAFVGCAWGMHHVGLVTITFGVTCSITSTLSGWLVKHLGRRTIFLTAAIINVGVNIIMLLWNPDSNQPIMFFVVAGMWGAIMGSFWSQLKAFHGILFKTNEEAAFGCYELSHSIGACVSFACSNYVCLYIKIYMLLIVSTIGIIGYLIAEQIRPRG